MGLYNEINTGQYLFLHQIKYNLKSYTLTSNLYLFFDTMERGYRNSNPKPLGS